MTCIVQHLCTCYFHRCVNKLYFTLLYFMYLPKARDGHHMSHHKCLDPKDIWTKDFIRQNLFLTKFSTKIFQNWNLFWQKKFWTENSLGLKNFWPTILHTKIFLWPNFLTKFLKNSFHTSNLSDKTCFRSKDFFLNKNLLNPKKKLDPKIFSANFFHFITL